ncbi:MAG: hypothetical protein ACOYT8_04520 [Candidatus Dependentiae bacterium]
MIINLFLITFFIHCFPLLCIEKLFNNNKSIQSNQDITIIFRNRSRITIPYSQAKKFSFFKNALDCTASQHKKFVIQLPEYLPKCVTKKNLSLLLRDKLEFLSGDEFNEVYQLADFLSAQDKIFYPLAKSYVKVYCHYYKSNEYEDLKKILGVKHYLLQGKQNQIKQISLTQSKLHLWAGQEIYSLDDINYLTTISGLKTREERERIKTLSIQYNYVSDFSIKKILSVFPNLLSLELKNNAIAKLDLPNLAQLPDNFTLDLRNNPITTIEESKIQRYPKQCTIYLTKTNNKKTDDQLQKILSSLNGSYQYTKHYNRLAMVELITIVLFFSLYYPSTPLVENAIIRRGIMLACLLPFIAEWYLVYHDRITNPDDNKIIFE